MKNEVRIESPFFRDELIRMLHDLGGENDHNEEVLDIKGMVKAINTRIMNRIDGAIPEGFNHVFISARFTTENCRHFDPCNSKMFVSNYHISKADHNEVVVTTNLETWIWYIAMYNKKSISSAQHNLASAVNTWLKGELAGIKYKKLFPKKEKL